MQPLSRAEERDLAALLDSFASAFSIDDIATAYSAANHDVHLAAEILCASGDEFKGATASEESAMISSASGVSKSSSGQGKSKFQPASLGTVSGIVGSNYMRHKTTTKPYQEVKKPLKIDSKEMPESLIWREKRSEGKAAAEEPLQDDVVNFLYKMLGEGFELEKDKIEEVLGLCGYDVEKTMEKLVDMSVSSLEKSDDISGLADENSGDQHPVANSASRCALVIVEELHNSSDSLKKDKGNVGLQKEILQSLFAYQERSENAPQRPPVRERPNRRYISRAELPEDDDTLPVGLTSVQQYVKEESDDENSFNELRKAVKEHWVTMKEYYKAAIEAFAERDYARVDRLLHQGHFYKRKAREANEKSAQKVLQTNETNDGDATAIPLDLVDHEPKEALSLLKVHLTNLGGIYSIKYIRAVVGTGDEDRKGKRKRMIIRLLEKNSIGWTEEDNGRILRIQVDVIDPKSLSFAPKK
ncbi:hypothetical protein RIF29_39143 [Crotalaria pallida]|uniref:DUF1771 domain-containing protein n=1 Tax=Crotalaria pallida TaxID=3830 RepID=A0AAN9HT10_CROPI